MPMPMPSHFRVRRIAAAASAAVHQVEGTEGERRLDRVVRFAPAVRRPAHPALHAVVVLRPGRLGSDRRPAPNVGPGGAGSRRVAPVQIESGHRGPSVRSVREGCPAPDLPSVRATQLEGCPKTFAHVRRSPSRWSHRGGLVSSTSGPDPVERASPRRWMRNRQRRVGGGVLWGGIPRAELSKAHVPAGSVRRPLLRPYWDWCTSIVVQLGVPR